MKAILTLLIAPFAVTAAAFDAVVTPEPVPYAAETPIVHTVEQVFMTMTNVAPFMIPFTETVTWTQTQNMLGSAPTDKPRPGLDPAYNVHM